MIRTGPDSLTSWIIAASCCFINTMMFGMSRLSGILFVASIPRFQVPRKKASLPYTLCSFMRNAMSPMVGYLGHKFGVRAVTTAGSIVGAIGAGMCYFAEDITTVTILWGIVFGLGFGLGNILLSVSINQHFDKHKATASGINFSGACFGSLILPSIVEVLLNKYGLSGTYLFLAGFILNCVPAALLLKAPKFKTSKSSSSDTDKDERHSIISEKIIKPYTAENSSQKSVTSSEIDNIPNIPNCNCKSISRQVSKEEDIKPKLTYDERVKRLSTQTLLSEYCIHMSTSEPLDADEIMENSKGRRQVDQAVLEAEVLSLSSQNTDQDITSEKDEVFEKESRSSSVPHEKKIPSDISNSNGKFPSESAASEKTKSFSNNLKEGYANYGYQVETDDLKLDLSKNFIPKKNIQIWPEIQSSGSEVYFSCTYQNKKDKIQAKQYREFPNNQSNVRSSEFSDIDNFKVKHGMLSPASEKDTDVPKTKKSSSLGSFSIIFDPAFLTIATSVGIYNFTFVCMITIIVDFAHGLNIGTSNEKYIIVAFSIGDLVGRLGLGWITDYGYMTATSFAAFSFAFQGIITSVIVLSDGFITLTVLSTLYGLSEAGIIVIIPVIIAQYIDKEKQTVAIPSSQFFSGPACLAVAPLIGYFRDDIGSYFYVFYIISILSAAGCLCFLLLPCISRCRKQT